MSGGYPKLALIFLLATVICTAGLSPVCAAQQRKTRKPAAKPEPPAPQPATPPVPLTLEQMPAVPPHVVYRKGELTIVAQNSTLGDILRAVRTQTGASVEIPANATERVVSQLGPAPAREVLAALLNGSHFNYVMLGTAADPNSLERIILTPKSGGGEIGSVAPAEANQPAFSPPQPMAANAPAAEQEDELATNDDFSDDSGDIEPIEGSGNQAAEAQQPNGQQGVVKTPEQLLQELQQQQQQQQQRMQKVPPGFPVPLNQQPPLPQPQPPQQQ